MATPITMTYGAHSGYYTSTDQTCGPACDPSHRLQPKCHFSLIGIRLTSTEIQQALYYFYAKATVEVEAFVSRDHIQKHMTKRGDILFHKSRIIDGQRWSRATSREPHELLAQGMNLYTPVVD